MKELFRVSSPVPTITTHISYFHETLYFENSPYTLEILRNTELQSREDTNNHNIRISEVSY